MPNNKRRKKKQKKNNNLSNNNSIWCNFIKSSAIGCHIVHCNDNWIIDSFDFNKDDWDDCSNIPDISIDPDSLLLTAINTSNCYKSYFISFPYSAKGKHGKQLKMGKTITKHGKKENIITLVLILYPMQVMDVCIIETILPLDEIELYSDIKELPNNWDISHLQLDNYNNNNTSIGPYLFPLQGDNDILCTQGINGGFTHFYPQTKYAVDLQCKIGTSVIAVGNGTIVDVSDKNTVSGIHTTNLFAWNSITIHLDDGYYVEYVHIMTNSSKVKVGDIVKEGQEICSVGNIGFCPSPHLHIQFHETNDPNAITIPFTFKNDNGDIFCPKAGEIYKLIKK